MTAPLVIFALLATAAGALKVRVPGTGSGFGELVHFGAAHAPASAVLISLSLAAALAGIGVAWAAYGANLVSSAAFNARFPHLYRLLKNAWYFNHGWELFATRIVIAGSALAAWFDRHVVNGMVDGVAWLSGWCSRRLRLAETGQLQFYAFIFVLGLVAGLLALFGGEASPIHLLRRGP